MGQLDGQVAIVTGSSRGIGHFIALELAKEGCNIVVAARSEEVTDPKLPGTIHTVAKELQDLGVEALAVKLDVTSDEDIEACIASTIDRFGRIDALINNAALIFPGPFLKTAVKRLDLLHRINVRGPYLLTQHALPHMLERGSGTVITISSGAADNPSGNNLIYAMSKVSIEKMMAGLAAETGDQSLRFFGLKPQGMVLSPGATYHGLPTAETNIEENDIMGRAAVWLMASDEAQQHNGESFYSRQIVDQHLGG